MKKVNFILAAEIQAVRRSSIDEDVIDGIFQRHPGEGYVHIIGDPLLGDICLRVTLKQRPDSGLTWDQETQLVPSGMGKNDMMGTVTVDDTLQAYRAFLSQYSQRIVALIAPAGLSVDGQPNLRARLESEKSLSLDRFELYIHVDFDEKGHPVRNAFYGTAPWQFDLTADMDTIIEAFPSFKTS